MATLNRANMAKVETLVAKVNELNGASFEAGDVIRWRERRVNFTQEAGRFIVTDELALAINQNASVGKAIRRRFAAIKTDKGWFVTGDTYLTFSQLAERLAQDNISDIHLAVAWTAVEL